VALAPSPSADWLLARHRDALPPSIALEDSAFMRDNLASTLMRTGRDHEAELHLVAGVRLALSSTRSNNELANIYRHTGTPGPSPRRIQLALALAPESAPVSRLQAWFTFAGETMKRLGYFDQALRPARLRRPSLQAVNDVGAWLASQGRTGEAEPLIRKAVELNPLLVQAAATWCSSSRPAPSRRSPPPLEQAIQPPPPLRIPRSAASASAPLPNNGISSSAATAMSPKTSPANDALHRLTPHARSAAPTTASRRGSIYRYL